MIFNKFLCLELRTGILAYGIFEIIGIFLAAIISFMLSLTDDEATQATDQTFQFGIHVINIIVLGCLTYGCYKERRNFLLPYIISHCLVLSLVTLLVIIFGFYNPVLFLLLFVLVFLWYVWLCVLSLYQMMDPLNPNYVSQYTSAGPDTMVYIDEQPPAYYENKGIDAV